MRQISQNYKTGELALVDVASPNVPSAGILVETRASLISAGTERMLVDLARKNLLQKAKARPDLVAKVIEKIRREGPLAALEAVRAKLDTAIPLGYSLAGAVTAVGRDTRGFQVGDRVACAGAGFANHAQMNAVPQNLAVHVPAGVSDEEAAFVTVAAIGLQGVRLAEPSLGETVAVVGLGLIGQLVVSLLTAHGCDVVGIDIDPDKGPRALKRGAVAVATIGRDDPVEVVRGVSRGRGADSVVITATSRDNSPLALAGELARDRAKISIVGFMPLEIPRKAYFEKELRVVVSRSYGPGRYDADYEERGRDYPVGYVRWTERRNLEAVIRAIATGRLEVKSLITHEFAFEDALDAYAIVTGEKPEPHLGVVLRYTPRARESEAKPQVSIRTRRSTKLGIAVVGTGSFASSVLLPKLAKNANAQLIATASGRGLSARHAAKTFGALRTAQSLDEVLAMEDVDAVVIATRHDVHAALAAKALDAGRDVFLEKPVAINEEQLEDLLTAARRSSGRLMVGFNRRFSPFAISVRSAFSSRRSGLVMTARINAGQVPSGSWIVDPKLGGGRIIGEACHFVDLLSFWAGAAPASMSVHTIGAEGAFAREENVVIGITFEDGSIASLIYTSMGDPAVPKEQYEVLCQGTVAHLDDWRTLRITIAGKTKTERALKANKGHAEELDAFIHACRSNGPSPIALSSIEATTRATLLIDRAIAAGTKVEA